MFIFILFEKGKYLWCNKTLTTESGGKDKCLFEMGITIG